MSVKLFLIRHGQTLWNHEGRYQGNTDVDLNGEGIRQAELAKKYLSRVDFSNIYSSPLKRAYDTARVISGQRQEEIIICEDLREIGFGKWEGLRFSDINERYRQDYQAWLDDPFNNGPTEGEKFNDLTERVKRCIGRIIEENDSTDATNSVAVVTHGGVIVSLIVDYLKIPPNRWRAVIQRQGAINVIVVSQGFPYIAQINYTGHLSPVYDDMEDKVIEIYSKLKK
jgi:alpha-ribazole phosphatase